MGCQLGNACIGNTGWSTGPHLHVYMSKLYPVAFKTSDLKVAYNGNDDLIWGKTIKIGEGKDTFTFNWNLS